MVYSDLPEHYRGIRNLDQTVTGVPDGAPDPFWPVAGDNEILCVWSAAEITRLLSAIRFGADMIYPDMSHTVFWSFLRQLEFPNEATGGEASMEIFTATHNLDGGASGGTLVAGNNIVPIFGDIEKADYMPDIDGNYEVAEFTPGEYLFTCFHVVEGGNDQKLAQPVVTAWVPSISTWTFPGAVRRLAAYEAATLMVSGCVLCDANFYMKLEVWANANFNNSEALGRGYDTRDSVAGRIEVLRLQDWS